MDPRRITPKRVAAAVVIAFAASTAGVVPAAAQEVPSITIATLFDEGNGCTVTRSTTVPAGVPVPVDAGGSPAPDLLVQLAAVPPPVGDGVATLDVTRLTLDPARLAVSVTVQGLTFGYDACSATTAPGGFRATASASGNDTSLAIQTTGPGDKLQLVGRSGAKTIDATLQPVPASTRLAFTQTAGGVTGTLTTDVPTRIDLSYVDGPTLRASATIDRFPGAATIEATSSSLHYTASGVVGNMTLDVVSGAGRLFLVAADLPTEVRIDRTGSTHVALRSGRIGDIIAVFSSGQVSTPLPFNFTDDHLAVRKEGAAIAARVRLRGVTSADVDWGDPVLVDLQHDQRRFTVTAVLDGLSIDGAISDLPSRATIRFSPTGRSLSYTGSSVITELRASVRRSAPLFERVTRADLLVRQLPASVNLTLAPSGSTFVLDANGATIGLIETLFTSGPDERLPAADDGVLFRELSDRYVIFARVTNLKRFTFTDVRNVTGSVTLPFLGRLTFIDHVKQANLVTAGGRPLRVDVMKTNPSEPDGSESALLTMSFMPADMTASVTNPIVRYEKFGSEADTGVIRMSYRANSTAGALHFDTDAGNSHNVGVHIEPMPRTLDVCKHADGNGCVTAVSDPDKGSLGIVASDRTRFSVFDCERLVNGSCLVDYTSLDLNLRAFVMSIGERSDGFHMFLDTDAHEVSGRILKVKGGTTEADFRFPDVSRDMSAQDRLAKVSCGAFSCSGDDTGQMFCPSGTTFLVNTHTFRYGTANFAEEICPG